MPRRTWIVYRRREQLGRSSADIRGPITLSLLPRADSKQLLTRSINLE